jgi:hypothetical protein
MSELPDDLRTFIRTCIKSVWALDALMLLHRRRDRAWTVAELERELRGSATLVAGLLPSLKHSGVVREDEPGRIRFEAATPALDRLVHELEAAYARTPLAVVKEILAAPNQQIQSFADAFRLKKD